MATEPQTPRKEQMKSRGVVRCQHQEGRSRGLAKRRKIIATLRGMLLTPLD